MHDHNPPGCLSSNFSVHCILDTSANSMICMSITRKLQPSDVSAATFCQIVFQVFSEPIKCLTITLRNVLATVMISLSQYFNNYFPLFQGFKRPESLWSLQRTKSLYARYPPPPMSEQQCSLALYFRVFSEQNHCMTITLSNVTAATFRRLAFQGLSQNGHQPPGFLCSD